MKFNKPKDNIDKALILIITAIHKFFPVIILIALSAGVLKAAQNINHNSIHQYMSVKNGLILEKFNYPESCRSKFQHLANYKEKCDTAWTSLELLLSSYSLGERREELDKDFWAKRNAIVAQARKARSGANKTPPKWWPEARRSAAINAHLKLEAQTNALQTFEKRKKG